MNEQLRQALRDEDTIIFIGSGISCWSGLPSWSGLLSNLSDFLEKAGRQANVVRRELKQDLLLAASYGFDQLTAQEIGDFMRRECQFGTATPHEIHRRIVTLGPRCFITTNYDQLIEESLRKWRKDIPVRVVNNRQPFETADIIQARKLDFIFKPHGDIADIESIVLTREQYRRLLEGGEWKHALESLKTLLMTRRVLYIGFGLRDPDFVLIRDVLANTWKGGTRDHYAVVADPEDSEILFWRKNYGIHLISYQTLPSANGNGNRDHTPLISLLDQLSISPKATPARGKHKADTASEVLRLVRHASGLMQVDSKKVEFPLKISRLRDADYSRNSRHSSYFYDGWNIDRFLLEGPRQSIVIGPPGSGKTYSLRQAAAAMAKGLHGACISNVASQSKLLIPLLADLKLYQGSLKDLIENTLPAGLRLPQLIKKYRVKIFLDSFNEMPRDAIDDGAFEADFTKLLAQFPELSIVIGSRTRDGLEKFNLPSFMLDEIDHEFVQDHLNTLGLSFSGRFESELITLLTRPFYFQLVIGKSVKLPKEPHPKDLYTSFLENLSLDCANRFKRAINLGSALREAAYKSVNEGLEVQPLKEIIASIEVEIKNSNGGGTSAEAICNWLVSRDFLLPYSGERVAFFHQSVTEFLAASELAQLFRKDEALLREKISLKRWDQALFLTLSLLKEDEADSFMRVVMEADFELSLNAVKYLEVNRDAVLTTLLEQLKSKILLEEDINFDFSISSAFMAIPFTLLHERSLRDIAETGNFLGAIAFFHLLQLRVGEIRTELFDKIYERRADFNFCDHLGEMFADSMEESDLPAMAELADRIEQEGRDQYDQSNAIGLVHGLACLLENFPVSVVEKCFLRSPEITTPTREARAEVTLNYLHDVKTTESLELACDLLLEGNRHAAIAIHFITHYGDEEKDAELDYSKVNALHVSKLLAIVLDPKLRSKERESGWALSALGAICAKRPDLNEPVRNCLESVSGVTKAALISLVSDFDQQAVFAALDDLSKLTKEEISGEPLYFLHHIDLEWKGREQFLVRLLRLWDTKLSASLLYFGIGSIGTIEIGAIEDWLDWLGEVESAGQNFNLLLNVSSLFAERLSADDQAALLREFNKCDSKYRGILARVLLPYRTDLTTEQFSSDAIQYLLDELRVSPVDTTHSLLAISCTEAFVASTLLPLNASAEGLLKDNLRHILKEAGDRHGRRYIAHGM